MKFLNYIIIGMLFLIAACSQEYFIVNDNKSIHGVEVIEGRVNPMIGLITETSSKWYKSVFAYAGVCSAEVSIYKISSSGQKEFPAIATTMVDANAKFKFEKTGLSLSQNYTNYLIEVIGEGGGPCDVVYQRPIIGPLTKQDVNYSTTILSFTLLADLPRKIHQIKNSDAESLMNELAGGNLDSTFNELVTNPTLRAQFFELFGGDPEKLQDIPPTIISEAIPSILNEEVTHQFSFNALHWSASYDIVVKWKLNGTTMQTSPIGTSFLFTPGKNDSGVHTLQAFIGKDDGHGELDTNFSYKVKSYNILVNNNTLPVVPDFTLPSGITSDNSIVVTINTGTDLINCRTFSNFSFTINDANTPSAASISSPCTDSINQDVTLNLGADGVHQIRLWVKDRSGLIVSSTPVSITKDSTIPETHLSTDKLIYSNGESIALTFSARDNLGLNSLELLKSEDGTNYTKVTDLNFTDTTYSLSAPNLNISNFKLKLKATDNAGLIHETIVALVIDIDAPSAPVVTLASATPTNSISTQLSISTCTDVDKILVKESSVTPLKTDLGWQNCTTSVGGTLHTLSLVDATKSLYAFAKDAAENISSASNMVIVTLDQTAPTVPSISAYPYAAFTSNNLQFTSPNCTGFSHLFISESSATPNLSNPAWQSCVTTSGGITHTLSSNDEGEFTLYAWAKDAAGNISPIKDFNFVIDKTAPVLSSIKINDDDAYTGTSFVTIKVGVSDNLSPIKVYFVEANETTGDCDSEFSSNNDWYDWSYATQEFSFALSNMDGVKKVCVWAKDAANNMTSTSLSDEIQFFVANPPKIVALNVYNPSDSSRTYTVGNNTLNIDWSISSTLDLASNPLSIAYTTDGSIYKDIITNQDISDTSKMTWLGSVGAGVKSASGTYDSFPAPTSFFRIKIFVKDVSGNVGIPVISDLQNAGNWSIYAGTEDRGVGGAGKAALLRGGYGQTPLIAIHPTTNDIYAVDSGVGIKKLDARTGLVTVFIKSGSNNLLSNGGILPTTPIAPISSPIMYFDKDGYLYLCLDSHETSLNFNQLKVYQINLTTRQIKLYLPGGSDIGTSSAPPNVSQMNIARLLGIDDENSLYIVQNCVPGSPLTITSSLGHRKYKIVKVVQNNTTKDAQEAISIAGNCDEPAIPANGSIATESPLPSLLYLYYMNVIVWEGGKNIYFFDSTSSNPYKIILGKFYTANTLTGVVSGLYQSSSGKLFATRNSNGLVEITPNLSGANGDVISPISGAAADGCSEDSILVSSACPMAWAPPVMNAQGKIFFTDGNPANTSAPYRVRYISSNNEIKTIFGTKALYGEGLTANLARGQFGGIYYKKSTELNQASFPEGLYFAEASGPAFGYINPTSKVTSIIWGDQSLRTPPADGSSVSKLSSMANPYAHINGQLLTFDSDGFPWLGCLRGIYSLNSSFIKTAKILGGLPAARYETRPDDTLIENTSNYVDGFQNNLQLSSSNLAFMLGAYDHTSAPMKTVLKAVNFGGTTDGEILAGTIKHVMGSTTTAETSVDSSVDSVLAKFKTISSGCLEGKCKTFYDEGSMRLYFTEDKKIRYVNNANTPSIATLHTLETFPVFIGNFTFSPDMSTLYYTDRTMGKLYCHNITSNRSECTSSTPLGPPSGATAISRVPNQFTWKDSSTLYISTFNGVIYEFKVP